MSHPTYLHCLRCRKVLAATERGRLYVRGLELRPAGAVWLYCDDPDCGGHAIYRPKASRGTVVTCE